MNIKNLRNLIRTGTAMMLVSAGMFFVSCEKGGGDDPVPPVITGQKHRIELDGVSGLTTKLSDMQSKADNAADSVLITVSGHFAVKSSDFSSLNELLSLLKKPNVKIYWAGKGIYPDADKFVLSTEDATTLSGILKSGAAILYNPKTNSMFWINSSDAGIFSAEILRHMGYVGARDFVITNTEDFEPQMQAAIKHAAAGEKAMVKIEKADVKTSQTHYFKSLLSTKNASFYPNPTFTVTSDTNPVPAAAINAFYDWAYGDVSIRLRDNANALAGQDHIMANDSTIKIIITHSTPKEKSGHVKICDAKGALENPAVGTFKIGTHLTGSGVAIEYPPAGMSVDGVPLQDLSFDQLNIGSSVDDDAGFYILEAGVRKANEKNGKSQSFYYPAIQGPVKLAPTKAKEYNYVYKHSDGKEYRGPSVLMNQVHHNYYTSEPSYFQVTLYDVIQKGQQISFAGDAITYTIVAEDANTSVNFGIQAGTYDGQLKQLDETLSQLGIAVPSGQKAFVGSERSVTCKTLDLSNYFGRNK